MPIRAFWWQCPWKSTSGPVVIFPGDPETAVLLHLGQELIDHEALTGDRRYVLVVGQQIGNSSRNVKMQLGSVPMMGDALAGVRSKHGDIAVGELTRLVDQPLGEHRPAATDASFLHDNVESSRLEQFYGADADARVVVFGERVVEVDDLPTCLTSLSPSARR